MRLGRFDLTVVHDGEFRLDGGAMFGVVPKPLWSRVKAADELNRIRMGTNALLVASGRELLLVDTGIGDKLDAKSQAMYGMEEGARRLPEQIRAAGYALGDVTHVLLTHLHFDHCGWNTVRAGEKLVPTFPNARYWLCRGEVEHARSPNERDSVSYLPENWEPLFEAGVVELFDDLATPIDGVTAVKAPGHNRDLCIVTVDGGDGARAAHLADLVPTAAHAPLPWIMGFDAFPMETLASKKRWVPRLAAERWLCIFQHDPDMPVGRILEEKPGKFRAVPVDPTGIG
ncbi:MAG: MBL fold metallo-hydrolase [Holophagales bacterium]|nr:MAG: MBL fold metallo-hydrolase [Holophagales bacterium]